VQAGGVGHFLFILGFIFLGLPMLLTVTASFKCKTSSNPPLPSYATKIFLGHNGSKISHNYDLGKAGWQYFWEIFA
jgi:uncharacterized protein YneF (UPF0154 family)